MTKIGIKGNGSVNWGILINGNLHLYFDHKPVVSTCCCIQNGNDFTSAQDPKEENNSNHVKQARPSKFSNLRSNLGKNLSTEKPPKRLIWRRLCTVFSKVQFCIFRNTKVFLNMLFCLL